MDKPKQEELEPRGYDKSLEPEVFTPNQLLEFLQSKGFIEQAYGGYMLTPRGVKVLKESPEIKEEITFYGHPNVKATHPTTFEVTKESELSEKGDCIIGVKADKSCSELSDKMRNALKLGRRVLITIKVDELEEVVEAVGSPALTLKSDTSVVIRKSDYIDDRTLAIMANKAAKDISREIVERLKNPETKGKLIIEVL